MVAARPRRKGWGLLGGRGVGDEGWVGMRNSYRTHYSAYVDFNPVHHVRRLLRV